MRLIPKDKVGKITFCQVHVPLWQENADRLELDPQIVAMLAADTEAAYIAFQEQRAAQQAAQGCDP